jgi:hypothetical protein
MKRFLIASLVSSVICLGSWVVGRTVALAAGSGDEAAVLQADTSLQVALKHKDAKATGALLDQDFTWTNEAGVTRKKAQFLTDAASGSVIGDTEYNNMKARDYGQLAVVTGVGKRTGHPGTVFARVWVKRPAGWLLLTHQDTPILSKGAPSAPTSESKTPGGSSDCDNPCRNLPITAKTPEQKEVVKAYEAVEIAVTAHDERTWGQHVADEFVGVGRRYTGTPDTKGERMGQIGIAKNKLILPKMISGEVYVFGDAGIILADHQPAGEPPFHVIRVWVNRDGRWQLFHRQETTIQKSGAAE